MFKEFRDFLAARNMLDLAVGVIIGGAITTVIKSIVDNLINPLIGVVISESALKNLYFKIASATFYYGRFLSDLLNFLITAFIVFLIIKFIRKAFPTKPANEKVDENLETLKEIRDLLKEERS
ncbi:MAG: large conductance mechanosensitive channel protein MscL [Streptococcaceae bacterium]|jgi:large conductance mechanosensitive channel|nr:large conductance mechanosensitive channel protein MscL [Streptococcaceae bacterium]